MSQHKVRLITHKMDVLVKFYGAIGAKEVDAVDGYTCMQLGESIIELCVGESDAQFISIELRYPKDIEDILEKMSSFVIRPLEVESGAEKQSFRAMLKDPCGNVLQLSCYQFCVSSEFLAG